MSIRVGPFGKDISKEQKIGGPTRRRSFNYGRLFALVINLIGSYFCFRVDSPLFPKIFVFLLSMMCVFMVSSEESKNPRMKSRSENYKTEHLNDDGTNTSFFSLLILPYRGAREIIRKLGSPNKNLSKLITF